MMRSQPEPLNFKLARVTPKWAFKQRSRRALVALLALSPFALIPLTALISSINQPIAIVVASLVLVGYVVILAWLIGATHAKADSPDEYLDEREIAVRNEVYLQSFRLLGALISLGFLVTTFLPADIRLEPRAIFGLLFPIALFLPTCVLAWTQPDSVEEILR